MIFFHDTEHIFFLLGCLKLTLFKTPCSEDTRPCRLMVSHMFWSSSMPPYLGESNKELPWRWGQKASVKHLFMIWHMSSQKRRMLINTAVWPVSAVAWLFSNVLQFQYLTVDIGHPLHFSMLMSLYLWRHTLHVAQYNINVLCLEFLPKEANN